jgi:hypothetical protein
MQTPNKLKPSKVSPRKEEYLLGRERERGKEQPHVGQRNQRASNPPDPSRPKKDTPTKLYRFQHKVGWIPHS